MYEQIISALKDYLKDWDDIATQPELAAAKPDALGWKVADAAEYAAAYQQLRPLCDRIVETWMNGRWIAKMHLKDMSLERDIKLIKLMQRRPGSTDALGLDHVDFICTDIKTVEAMLVDSGLRWSWETNDVVDDYRWISIWFAGTEAKLKDYSVIDIVIRELQQL